MINTILNMSLGGLVDLAVSAVVLYNCFAFFAILIFATVILIYEKAWDELVKVIGWYFLVTYAILFAVSVLGFLIGLIFKQDFALNGIEFSSIVIFCIVCFIVSMICMKIGDYLALGEDHKREKEWGSVREIQKIQRIIGFDNWVLMEDDERKEYIRKLRNHEKIEEVDIRSRYGL